jgi:hypothetical protein
MRRTSSTSSARPRRRSPPDPYAAAMFGAAGLALLALAATLFARKRAEVSRWVRAPGTLSGYASRRDARGRTLFYPQYTYVAQGRTYAFAGTVGGSAPGRDVGAAVAVLFDPAMPERATIDSVTELHFVALLVALVALVALVVAVAIGVAVATTP